MHLTFCFYHVTYAFQSESTLYNCLNIKELLPWSRCKIWCLSDCNLTQNHNPLVHKWTLSHLAKLAKWLSCVEYLYVWCIWLHFTVFIYELHGCRFEPTCSHLNFRFCTCFKQGVPWHSRHYRVWIHSKKSMWHDKNKLKCTIQISTHNAAQLFGKFG